MDDNKSDIPRMGGKARAASMTKEERSASAKLAALSRWTEGGLPKATHAGVLKIGELEVPCYVLENGKRVLSQGGMSATLGMTKGGSRKIAGDRVANFLAVNALKPFLPEGLTAVPNLGLRFRTPGGGPAANGYEAKVLSDICKTVLAARRAGAIGDRYARIAEQCEILQGAFAEVGINALVDEATGYQANRARDALAKILEAYIAKELRPYMKTFPPDFYKHMFRLKGWAFPEEGKLQAKPPVVGKYTNDLVYERLAPGVLEELRRVTPRDEKGRIKQHFHRRLTEDTGYAKLREHLAVVTAFMKAAPNWDGFQRSLDLACPRFGKNYLLQLEE